MDLLHIFYICFQVSNIVPGKNVFIKWHFYPGIMDKVIQLPEWSEKVSETFEMFPKVWKTKALRRKGYCFSLKIAGDSQFNCIIRLYELVHAVQYALHVRLNVHSMYGSLRKISAR